MREFSLALDARPTEVTAIAIAIAFHEGFRRMVRHEDFPGFVKSAATFWPPSTGTWAMSTSITSPSGTSAQAQISWPREWLQAWLQVRNDEAPPAFPPLRGMLVRHHIGTPSGTRTPTPLIKMRLPLSQSRRDFRPMQDQSTDMADVRATREPYNRRRARSFLTPSPSSSRASRAASSCWMCGRIGRRCRR
jgi:hypothetical protein